MAIFKEILPTHAMPVSIIAYAKINLQLSVFAKAPEAALHDLGSLFHTISLYDTLHIKPARTFKFSLKLGPKQAELKADEALVHENLLVRAWTLLKQTYGLKGEIHITLEKRIPVGAGLGGGSSDVAALITWVERAYGLGLARVEQEQIAIQLGSDVAFFLQGGMAWVEGVGDKIIPLTFSLCSLATDGELSIIESEITISTRKAYTSFVRLTALADYQKFKNTITEIERSHVTETMKARRALAVLSKDAENAFELKTLKHYEALQRIHENLRKYSSYTLLTGSGSAFFAYTQASLPEKLQQLSSVKQIHAVRLTPTGHEIAMS